MFIIRSLRKTSSVDTNFDDRALEMDHHVANALVTKHARVLEPGKESRLCFLATFSNATPTMRPQPVHAKPTTLAWQASQTTPAKRRQPGHASQATPAKPLQPKRASHAMLCHKRQTTLAKPRLPTCAGDDAQVRPRWPGLLSQTMLAEQCWPSSQPTPGEPR